MTETNIDARYIAATTEYAAAKRNTGPAYLWWLFLGAFGAHKFYLGRTGWGLAYLFTLAFLSLGLWVDLFMLPSMVRKRNAELEREIYGRHGIAPATPTPGLPVSPPQGYAHQNESVAPPAENRP